MELQVGQKVKIGPYMEQSMERYRGREVTIRHYNHIDNPVGMKIPAKAKYVYITIPGTRGPQNGNTWCALAENLIPIVPSDNRMAIKYHLYQY